MWEDDDLDLALSTTMGMLGHSIHRIHSGQPLSTIEVGEKLVTVVFDLPGVRQDEVFVTCTDDTVSVEAEVKRVARVEGGVTKGFARYSKVVTLPVKVVSQKGTAKFRNGMITVKLPRRQEGPVNQSGKRLKFTA